MKNQKYLKTCATNIASKLLKTRKNKKFFSKPFKHLFIDNLIEENFAKQCMRDFPNIKKKKLWEKSDIKSIEIKYRSVWESEFDIPENIVDLVRILNSSIVLKALSKIFSIPKLMSDPYFSGGGLNVTEKGGLLDVHVDGNYHDASGLNRRLNILLYFNPGWKKSWGGEFGIYSNDGKKCVKKIEPLFNRLIAFDTHDYSYHGLPNPINFPKSKSRKSLILYYYTREKRPKNQIKVSRPHSALWLKKNFLDKKGKVVRRYS
ncbi:2OG-Fe(II) oxygenase [Candidatus Pelagibacter sp.]|jgi:Rps23 Pro-64 3,4-dihydroxylase Tpa1-like proline 4-hydroxylase|nr:2OG-Fe(II) oxygenase [Candidatus Pelagibacter sp.]